MGWGEWPRIADHVGRLYCQDSWDFAPPTWLVVLPVSQCTAKEDRAWRDLQAQSGLHGSVLSRSLVQLEAAVNAKLAHKGENRISKLVMLHWPREDMNKQVATPVAHALSMAGDYSNHLSAKRRKCLAESIKDQQLGRWLGADNFSLFPSDVLGTMGASRA